MQYFTKKSNPLLKKTIVAALISNLAAGNAFAQETIPNTYVDLPVPQLTGWNDINIRTLDGSTGATPKSLVDPAAGGSPGDAVGAIYWELDNGSGRSPGVQVVTDDFDFPTNNCIMASGELENEDLGVALPKTCSDPNGSSKRYKFELLASDQPVDLIFNLGIQDIRYKGIKDPATDGGAELDAFRATTDIGRIYRVIQKIINNTDERIASYTFEIGTGLGDSFQPLNYENDGVSFELRTLVPRAFLEGETGAPDIEVWDPMTFATFSPKMFNDGGKKGIFGFMDHEIAGFMPPQVPAAGVEKSSVIDSGTTIINGVIGPISPNYFDVEKNYTSTTGESIDIPVPGKMMLGYMLPDSLLPTVIGEYSVNVVGGESDAIIAFWDGTNWRSGRAGLDGDPDTFPDNFAAIDAANDDKLIQWAGQLLGTGVPGAEIPRFDSFLSDDLSGLNTDIFIHINDKLFDDNGDLKLDSITLRVTANSIAAVIGDVPGSETPAWMASEPPSLADYLPGVDGTPIPLNDASITEENLNKPVNVLKNDLIKSGTDVISINDPSVTDPITITVETQPANGAAAVYSGPVDPALDNTIVYTGNPGFFGEDSFEYSITVDGIKSPINATVVMTVQAAPIPDAPVASNDSAVTFESTAVTLNVLENDDLKNGSPVVVSVSIDNTPINGTAAVEADNTVTYTPNEGYIGSDRFTYNVDVDGKVSNSALITVRVDESVSSEQKMKSSSSGHTSGLLLLAIAGLLIGRRRYTLKK